MTVYTPRIFEPYSQILYIAGSTNPKRLHHDSSPILTELRPLPPPPSKTYFRPDFKNLNKYPNFAHSPLRYIETP